jgi:hypothetical protein
MPVAAALAIMTLFAAAFTPGRSDAAVPCVDGGANEARASGEDEGPPTFSPAFLARAMSIEASADGLSEGTLPVSIEQVCGVPRRLRKEAEALAGGDGVAVVTSRTSVWKDGVRLSASRKLVELDGADTVRMRVRLLPQPSWLADEDGEPLPTFRTSRVLITD